MTNVYNEINWEIMDVPLFHSTWRRGDGVAG
jgi:hypothetical protein